MTDLQGYPVTTRQLNYGALVRELWGEEYTRSDVCYEFSNGREFLSSDRSPDSGIYE